MFVGQIKWKAWKRMTWQLKGQGESFYYQVFKVKAGVYHWPVI